MIMKTIQIREIIADEGFLLTNGQIVTDSVYLGAQDSPENWRQISVEEYENNKQAYGALAGE